jgi:Na+/H+ antiporter NhaD/arsenite permease-like protein
MVGAVIDTRYPKQLLDAVLASCSGAKMPGVTCMWQAIAVIVFLSNLVSNVPVILMLATLSGLDQKAWIFLSWVTTVAGNLTMIGSAANIIVASGAQNLGDNSFQTGRHLWFGVPTTIVVLIGGVFIINGMDSVLGGALNLD